MNFGATLVASIRLTAGVCRASGVDGEVKIASRSPAHPLRNTPVGIRRGATRVLTRAVVLLRVAVGRLRTTFVVGAIRRVRQNGLGRDRAPGIAAGHDLRINLDCCQVEWRLLGHVELLVKEWKLRDGAPQDQ